MRGTFGIVAAISLLLGCSSNSSTTPDGAGGGSVDMSQFASAAQICTDTINQYRATLKLAAYTKWTAEESCAGGQAEADSVSGTPHSAFTKCSESAQDECPGWPGPPEQMIPQCLAAMWAEGPGSDFSKHGHYINMSNASYTSVACGFYVLPNGSVWAAQDFH